MRVPRGLLFSVVPFVLATYVPLCTTNVCPTAWPWDGKIAGDDWPT